MKTIVLLISLSLLASSSQAEKGGNITIEDALEMAVSRNRTLLSAEERINEARLGQLSAAGNFLPAVSAGGSFTRLDAPRIPGDMPGAFTGADSYSLTGSVQMPLFTGFRNIAAYRSASAGVALQEENYRKELNDLKLSVKEAFYNALLAEELIRLNRESEIRLEKHLEQTRTLYENGLASRLDLLRSEVQLSNLRPQVIQAENSLRMARSSLALLTGLEEKEAKSLRPRGELTYTGVEANLERSVERALSERPEIRIIRHQKTLAEEGVTAARSASYPQVSATYNRRLEHPHGIRDEWGSSWNLMVNVSLPLFRGFSTYSEIEKARSRLSQLEHSESLLRETIRLDVENAYYTLLQEEETIAAFRKNAEQAGEALDIAETRYRSGLITNLEFMDAELSYMQAQVNLLRSKADYIIAVSRLRQASGGE